MIDIFANLALDYVSDYLESDQNHEMKHCCNSQSSISKLVYRLTDKCQVCVERAGARPHTIHIGHCTSELNAQVCHSIIKDF